MNPLKSLALCLCLCISIQANAQTSSTPSGSGTSGDPYLIENLNHLYWITTNPTQWDKVYQQTANIDASATSTWNADLVFSTQGGSCFMGGTYPAVAGNPEYGDSNFYVSISNIGSQYSSFRVDLADGGYVTFYAYYGDTWGVNPSASTKSIACGTSYNFATTSTGMMPIGNINTAFTGTYNGAGYSITNLSISRDTPAYSAFDGTGLFGRTSGATIQNLTVEGTAIVGENRVGLLVGYAENSTFTNVSLEATSITGNQYVGGLSGYADGTLTIQSVGSKIGTVTADFAHAGGLLGMVSTGNTSISNCYSRADVTTNGAYAGGLFDTLETTGGTLDWLYCYAEGDITAGTKAYAIDVGFYNVASSSSVTVQNLLMDTTNDPINASNISVGKSAAQMKTLSTFTDADWDFSTVWALDASVNDGYPYLSSSPHATIATPGFRLFGVPSSSATYADILEELWTQGSSNADVSTGSSNIWTWDGTSWNTITDLNTTPSAGQGFLSYVFSDPDYDQGSKELPVVLSTSESFYNADVSITGSTNDGTPDAGWTLVSNPFNEWLSVDELFNGRNSNFSSNAYIYNPVTTSFSALSGADGQQYFIAPYQGFFVQDLNDGTDAGTFSIPLAAKTTDNSGTFYKRANRKSVGLEGIVFELRSKSKSNSKVTAELTFHPEAFLDLDGMDAYLLKSYQQGSQPYLAWSISDMINNSDNYRSAMSHNFISKNKTKEQVLHLDAGWFELNDEGSVLTSNEMLLAWNMKGLSEDANYYLVDQILGVQINMNEQTQYEFTSEEAAMPISTNQFITESRHQTRFSVIIQPVQGVHEEWIDHGMVSNEGFELKPNYPNPFNPTTNIIFTVHEPTILELSIYNTLGQTVIKEAKSYYSEGLHSYIFDAKNLPSGLYFVTLSSDKNVKTQPMILAK